MKIFLDTAEVDQIIDGYKTGLVDGVTTNPTLILRSGRQQLDVIEEIYQACPNLESISAEVVADYPELSHPDLSFVGGESFTVTFTRPGDYEFQCEPHAGAGMKGVIHVS